MRALLAVLLLAAALAPAVPAAATCGGGETIRSTARYRVYVEDGLYLACLRSAGKVTELYEVDSNDSFGKLRVAGRYVAVIAGSCSSSGCDYWVVLGDMRRGLSRMVSDEAATNIVLRATGSLAYSVGSEDGAFASIELVRWGRPRTRTLAIGAKIDPLSLRRSGTRAVWRDGGETRSARLP